MYIYKFHFAITLVLNQGGTAPLGGASPYALKYLTCV